MIILDGGQKKWTGEPQCLVPVVAAPFLGKLAIFLGRTKGVNKIHSDLWEQTNLWLYFF